MGLICSSFFCVYSSTLIAMYFVIKKVLLAVMYLYLSSYSLDLITIHADLLKM